MTVRALNANPIEQDMSAEDASEASSRAAVGEIIEMAIRYNVNSARLLGFALAMGYEEIQFTTYDPWKRKNGGVARNQFILIKLGEGLVNPEGQAYCRRLSKLQKVFSQTHSDSLKSSIKTGLSAIRVFQTEMQRRP